MAAERQLASARTTGRRTVAGGAHEDGGRRFSSAASDCMKAGERGRRADNTAAGLPRNGPSANASTWSSGVVTALGYRHARCRSRSRGSTDACCAVCERLVSRAGGPGSSTAPWAPSRRRLRHRTQPAALSPGRRVVGLDPSRRRSRARGAARRGVPLVQGDAEALPFRNGAFDTVVSAALVFCSGARPDARLVEVKRVLSAAGALRMLEHVRATVPSKRGCRPLAAAVGRASRRLPLQP